MNSFQQVLIAFLMCSTSVIYGQLGFCGGSTGDAIFTESFGNGTTFGPPLAPGTTTYPFVTGAPNDGFYTLNFNTGLYSSWHNSPDHSADATDGINGKCLIVNANNNVSGEFYKRTVSGLCVNTTFEFSAWVMNVYNPLSNVCTNNQIPINVRFEIWNDTQTVLLSSGNTGNIFGSTSPLWQQFALVFTTGNETSVVLIMKNNGVGGCGNDLAIDDIAFKSCGDLTTVSNPSYPTNILTTCDTNASVTLNASTSGTSSYFYQWQSSTDNENWTNILGQNSASFTTPGVANTTYFRTKIAQDIANINSPFCSTVSNVFTVAVLPPLPPAVSTGDVTSCAGDPIPSISVTSNPSHIVNWYSQPIGGTLLLSASNTYSPLGPGTFYAEVVNPTTGCLSSSRTAVTASVKPKPIGSFSGSVNYCSGENTAINLESDLAGTTFTWVVASTAVTGATDGTGTSINQTLTSNGFSGSVTYTVTPQNDGCSGTPFDVTLTVFQLPTASFSSSSSSICSNEPATLLFTGTANSIVNFTDGTNNYQVPVNGSGFGTFTTPALVTPTTFNLQNVQATNAVTCLQTLNGSVTVSINQNPSITSQPVSTEACVSESVTFTVTATGTNLSYQWLFNGAAIAGATNSSFTIASVSNSDEGNYRVVITGICGLPLESNTVALVVADVTTITTHPQANTTICEGQPLNLSVNATGTAVTYQWFRGTTLLAGQTSAILNIGNTTLADAGSYTVQVTQGSCSVLVSNIAQVTVNQVAAITSQPQNQEVCVGETATFSVVAGGTNLTYQWFKGTTAIAGSTSSTLIIPNITQADNGDFYCEITSPACSTVTSITASLLVNSIPFATIIAGTPSFICEGESGQIIFNGTPEAIVTYTINGGSTQTITLNPVGLALLDTGVLTETTVIELVSVSFNNSDTCSQNLNGTATIIVNPIPTVNLQDGKICVDPLTLTTTRTFLLSTGLNQAEFTFEWFDGIGVIPLATNSFYEVNTSGQYSVTITDIVTGCQASAFANVGQSAPATDFTFDVSGFFADNPTIIITAAPAADYEYQLDFGPFQDSNEFENVAAGVHTLTVRDAEGCGVLSKEVLIVDYPRFFTPNGDGINDSWNITSIGNVSVSKISIFDQFGRFIKQMNATESGWDGTYICQNLPANDYWFTITYQEGGITKEFRSHFSLKR
jgi:gliding motility-associated-like protein